MKFSTSSFCCLVTVLGAASSSAFTINPSPISITSLPSQTALNAKDPNPVFPVWSGDEGLKLGEVFGANGGPKDPTFPYTTKKSQSSRRPVVAGNWKLNPETREAAIELFNGLKEGSKTFHNDAEVIVFPPLTYLSDALSILSDTNIQVGAQNASPQTKGAFTGEIAPSMLASSGCSHVLLGHSERRTIFGESDSSINARMKACLEEETKTLKVILCVGETLEEYESGLLNSVVDTQLRKGLAGVSPDELLNGRIIVAYEPVWAIGTGLVATPDQAQTAHLAVRSTLSAMFPHYPAIASEMRIQYGGSVSADSVKDLMAMPDVDGALVGGASLVADSFTKIIEGAAPALPVPPMAIINDEERISEFFSHAQKTYFDVELLTSKGPRKNADVGEPHDSSRPLNKDGALSTGSWWCAAGGWPSPALRATTEVFYVFSGNGCVTDIDGTRNYFGPGDTVMLPKGWSGRWDVLEDIHKVWAVTDHPDVMDGSVDPKKAIVKPYSALAAQNLKPHSPRKGATRGSPMDASETWLDNGYMGVGGWACTPGSFAISNPATSEAFHILEGEFFLTNAVDGSAQKCKAGDTILLPKGWSGEWDVLETVKKVWVVVK